MMGEDLLKDIEADIRISATALLDGRVVDVHIHSSRGWILACSEVVEIDDRCEVGMLTFQKSSAPSETFFEIAMSVQSIGKLIVVEKGVKVDSGVEFMAVGGGSLCLVPNAFPYSLSLSGTLGIASYSNPEYPIGAYAREILSR